MTFFIGPMSKNIVDAVMKFNKNMEAVGLIPSRRQVDFDTGYVNNWNTQEFANYVRKNSANTVLERDHGGPGQGRESDDGVISLKVDLENGLDIIHIDPWKISKTIEEGIDRTLVLIELLEREVAENANKGRVLEVEYEVGTEEAIMRYEDTDLDLLLSESIKLCGKKIKYGVVQFGTAIVGRKNVGTLDEARAKKMVEVCKKHQVLSKEHNGDYLKNEEVMTRFSFGLDALNIAPEFGGIETSVYLEYGNEEFKEFFFKLCSESNKWKKWFPKGHDPEKDKEELVKVAGHYVFSSDLFKDIKKQHLPMDIDFVVQERILAKISSLHIAEKAGKEKCRRQ